MLDKMSIITRLMDIVKLLNNKNHFGQDNECQYCQVEILARNTMNELIKETNNGA